MPTHQNEMLTGESGTQDIKQTICRTLWERFLRNVYVFPEILITSKTQKMPNHASTRGCQTAL